MSSSRRPWKSRGRGTPKFLDQFSVNDIERCAKFQDRILRLQWDYYSGLAYQRSQITDDIRSSILGAVESPFRFSKWQRIIGYKHSLEPLSVSGSILDPGGRFNIGEINPNQFFPFPALYLAADKNTALQERLSQGIPPGKESKALDFALAKPDSIVAVSLSGCLKSIVNLKKPAKLENFVNLIKDFSIPNHLDTEAKTMGLAPLKLARTTTDLLAALLSPHWRLWPMQFDLPHTSQIFGQLVVQAGIAGILYPSKFNNNDCLVIFPQNFEDSSDFVELDDPSPKGVRIHRLDATTRHLLKGES